MRAPVRLKRDASTAGQAGCATMIGVVLTAGGGVILVLALSVAPPTGRGSWVIYVVGVGFSLVGCLMLFAGVKLALIARLPETIVEVERLPVRAGQPFEVTVRQPGPMHLASLRLNLVGEQHTRRQVWRRGRHRTEIDRRLIHQDNVLDLHNITIERGEEFAHPARVVVPAAVTCADIEGDRAVVWRLEVWGRVRRRVDFGHPFAITVSGCTLKPPGSVLD